MAYKSKNTTTWNPGIALVIVEVAVTSLAILDTNIKIVEPCNRALLVILIWAIALFTIFFSARVASNVIESKQVSIAGAVVILLFFTGSVVLNLFSDQCNPIINFHNSELDETETMETASNESIPSENEIIEPKCYIYVIHSKNVRRRPLDTDEVVWYMQPEDGRVEVIGSSAGDVNEDLWWLIRANDGINVGWVWSGAVEGDTICPSIITPTEGVPGSFPAIGG